MKIFLALLAGAIAAGQAFGQGQVVFANKVGTLVDAPVMDWRTGNGLGPNFTAQLYLQGQNGSLSPLVPSSTFRQAGVGAAAIADRYWITQTLDIPGVDPGTAATFVVRVWETAYGSYAQAQAKGGSYGDSAPFTVTVGGGILPPANLTTLQSFGLVLPEPGTITLGVLGALALLARSSRRAED